MPEVKMVGLLLDASALQQLRVRGRLHRAFDEVYESIRQSRADVEELEQVVTETLFGGANVEE